MKRCSKCGHRHGGKARYCAKCHAAYMREWRKTHPLTGEAQKRDNARAYANVYVRRGLIARLPCQKCGAAKSEMHHPDHELPKEVIWLCRPCHLAWHEHCRDTIKRTFLRWIRPALRRAA